MGSSKASLLLVIRNLVVNSQYFCCVRLQLHSEIYRADSFAIVLMPHHWVNLKAVRYESTSLNRIAVDKSHRVIVA